MCLGWLEWALGKNGFLSGSQIRPSQSAFKIVHSGKKGKRCKNSKDERGKFLQSVPQLRPRAFPFQTSYIEATSEKTKSEGHLSVGSGKLFGLRTREFV